MIDSKPSHKFFDVVLDNNLEELHSYLTDKEQEIMSGDFPNLEKDVIDAIKSKFGFVSVTQVGHNYNIFSFENEAINKLKLELKNLTREACAYYGVDFESQYYVIHGWFNFDKKIGIEDDAKSISDDSRYHDHAHGLGAPDFHGYYCVEAEPSITYYKIDSGETIFENMNVNNRAIISETGHPHTVGSWKGPKTRITIAYDIMPSDHVENLEVLGYAWSAL